MPELTAYHESGHVLVAVLLGGKVKLVTLEPENEEGPERQGYTQIHWPRRPRDEKEFAAKAVQACLAGPVAEMIYSGDSYHPGFVAEWAEDWREAWEAAEPLHADARKRLAYLEQVCVQLYQRLKSDELWPVLASLADHLLAHETLEGEQVEEIVGEWLR